MKPSIEYIVYLIGAGLAGIAYGPIKERLSSEPLSLFVVVAYVAFLRILGIVLKRAINKAPKDNA
jgi:acyl-CoA synthetase (AMP-forming)/AMP-acid ligase II